MFNVEVMGYRKIPSKKNSMSFNTKTKRMYKAADVKEFESYLAQLANEAKAQWEAHNKIAWPMGKQYYLKIECVWGDKRVRDLQNVFASVCDALNGILYDDDCQITRIAALKKYEKNTWTFNLTLEVEQ